MNQDLNYNIDNLKGLLPEKGRLWIQKSKNELAKKIRDCETIINHNPNDWYTKETLKETLYELTFFRPWEYEAPSVEPESNEPPPYVEYQIIEESNVFKRKYGVELESGDLITLPCFGIILLINKKVGMAKVLQSELTDDYSLEDDDNYISAMRAIEMMIISHAMYGVDVCSDDYVCGIEAAVEECGDLYG